MKRLNAFERTILLVILLLAWGLRWFALMEVPPGWRDDDLVEVYTFSNEILTEGIKLYYAEAWGQGPLYHTIRAPVLAFGGVNQASVRWLSALCGTLAVLLTWAMGRRLFTPAAGLLAGACSAVSFWSLMYSRVAIRHIGALPWMLLALYGGWRLLHQDRHIKRDVILTALGTSGSMLTYYAGRLIPVVLLAALLLVKSDKTRRKRLLLALAIGLLLTLPTFITAYFTPGADARVSELALPITALLKGDAKPLIQNAWMTLGMFHAHGDPEWLYNIAFRPVLGPITFAFFLMGMVHQVVHLQNSNSRLTLSWLIIGISPAIISLPESSLGHTILALPVTYIILAAVIIALPVKWRKSILPFSLLIFALISSRDLPDYFRKWPNDSMVNFLYRGDYRQTARYLDAKTEVTNAAIGTMLFGPWDKTALETDIHRRDTTLRWINPDRALVNSASGKMIHYLQEESHPLPQVQDVLNHSPRTDAPPGLQGFIVTLPEPGQNAIHTDAEGVLLSNLVVNESMLLEAVQPVIENGEELMVITWWKMTNPLPLPPEKLYPPPYGVYGGPRLRVFAHLRVDGEYFNGDDGFWADPYSLQPGDRLLQIHRFDIHNLVKQEMSLSIGLYDPWTGERWLQADGEDHIVISIPRN